MNYNPLPLNFMQNLTYFNYLYLIHSTHHLFLFKKFKYLSFRAFFLFLDLSLYSSSITFLCGILGSTLNSISGKFSNDMKEHIN